MRWPKWNIGGRVAPDSLIGTAPSAERLDVGDRPLAERVSIASESERKAIPLPSSIVTKLIKCERLRPRRSSFQATRVSLALSKLKTVNLELPDYVWTELKIRAAHQQTSLKHVIMKALLADGITIKACDMIEDGRRLRGANKR
jgi:hypothetical protein